jgi:hypothetical protein
MMSPREIKARRILLGIRVKDLAEEAGKAFKRPVGDATISQILARRVSGDKPQVHELQKFIARKLKIPVGELKPPFDTSRWSTK